MADALTAEDQADLRRAAALLEGNNLVVRLSMLAGRAIEGAAAPGFRMLPEVARDGLRGALEVAINRVFDVAAGVAAKIECLEVFALGSPRHRDDDEADIGYYAIRLGFARTLRGVGGRVLTQVLPGAVTAAASRFGVPLAYKVAVEAVPVLGAATGAVVNALFVDHFQSKARGHFIIRRLERRYGEESVREAYEGVARA